MNRLAFAFACRSCRTAFPFANRIPPPLTRSVISGSTPSPANRITSSTPPSSKSSLRHQRLEQQLHYVEDRILRFSDDFESFGERIRKSGYFNRNVFWILGTCVAVGGGLFLVFQKEIYEYLGRGGAEVAAEVIKSEKLQHQVEESLHEVVERFAKDEETRKALVVLLQRLMKDPETVRVVADFGKRTLNQLIQEPWFQEQMKTFVTGVLKDLSMNEHAKQHTSKFFQDVFSDPSLQKSAGTGLRKAAVYGVLGRQISDDSKNAKNNGNNNNGEAKTTTASPPSPNPPPPPAEEEGPKAQ